MKHKMIEKEWAEEFKDFVSFEESQVPEELSQEILQRVHRDLNPSAWIVFSKLFSIHLFVGTLSLALCNQFGLNPFKTSFSLSDYFMRFGHSTCMVLCGVLFIGLTVALSRAVMNADEFRVLSRDAPLQVFGLAVFSLVGFLAFGADIVLGIGVLWLIGAMVGGVGVVKAFSLRAA